MKSVRELDHNEMSNLSLLELANYVKEEIEVLLTFDEAWNHKDPKERKLWREAIRAEFKSIILKGVWRYGRRSEIPGDRRLIGYKWVFQIKSDGRYRARLTECGYT